MNYKYTLYTKQDDKSIKISSEVDKKLLNRGFIKVEDSPDYIIVIGGDGTFLRAVHDNFIYLENVLFIGIHTGNLGFYCDWKVESIDLLIESLSDKQITTVEFPLLEYNIDDSDIGYALNEVTIINPIKTLTTDLYINDEYFETIHGTGVCVSTPSGSSAYNKSLGGAVVDPHVNSIQITEIAPIISNVHRTLGSAIVLGPSYRIELRCKNFSDTILTSDHLYKDISKNNVIKCNISMKKIKIGMHTSNSFLHRVQKSFLD